MNTQELVDRVQRLDRLYLDMLAAQDLHWKFPHDPAIRRRYLVKAAKYQAYVKRWDEQTQTELPE